MSRRRDLPRYAVPVVLSGLALACQGGQEIAPPTVHYGEDVCAACNMIISEERFATAFVAEDEYGDRQSVAFDDIGCMFLYEKQKGSTPLARYVHDLVTHEWVEAERAIYIRSRDIRSPMGSGVAAYSGAERARVMAERVGGDPLSFDDLIRIDGEVGLLQLPDAVGTRLADEE